MVESQKRKEGPDGQARPPHPKKSKGSSGGKWQTPSHKAKLEALKAKNRTLQVGDRGFWVTCQRHQETKALSEVVALCDEYGETMYGIKPAAEEQRDEEAADVDIEASIKNELASMSSKVSDAQNGSDAPFAPMRVAMDCLIFVKTKSPVEPADLVHRVCEDAKGVSDHKQRKSRFLNRLTPIELIGRATESGLEEVARTVLSKYFKLKEAEKEDNEGDGHDPSYAIRPSFRAHAILKRDDVIKKVASMIGPSHKVNLTKPDKVILIEVFQNFCGIGVVGGDWEELKRYNIRELYEKASGAPRNVKGEESS